MTKIKINKYEVLKSVYTMALLTFLYGIMIQMKKKG
jgi:hypothetical protein